MTEATTEGTEAPARGRPRPDATVERDAKVLAFIAEAGESKNRKEIADGLGLPGNEVYLSLYRLSRAEPAKIVKDGGRWKAAEAPVAG